ncbi:claudin-7-A-like [Alosa pseudoharengus]|uniref:claudin-7-A-like n=1 Tax=Alosa pseudoharengus TaxID=34774 RepID=UPI003F8B4865
MANGCVQVFACILASVGLVCLITSTCVNEWKTNGYTNEGVNSFKEYVGLWMKCSVHVTQLECTVFDSLESVLYQRGEIQWTRAMMIISIILSVCGLAVAVLGMKFTLCLDVDKQVKNKVAFVGGILLILSGVCALGIVSWYANGVITNFHNPKPEEKRYTLGKCLFLGWGGALLSFIGGALLACCSLSRSASRRSYASPPPVPMTSEKDYV